MTIECKHTIASTGGVFRKLHAGGLALLCGWTMVMPALAGPTQEEVFRSIQTNVGNPDDGSLRILLLVLAGAVILILLGMLNRREKKQAVAQALNHQGKLLKEIVKATGLKPTELKQLKMLAERLEERHDIALKSPLTLMLCPSLLAKAMAGAVARPSRFDTK